MAGLIVPISGPVSGSTAYCENKLVARDVAFTLPEVTPIVAEMQATGPMSLPMWSMVEAMETAITKIGIDEGLGNLIKPDMKPLEFRWAQTVTDTNGVTKNVGCKAFVKGIPVNIPAPAVTVGETIEGEVRIATTRYALFVDGKEYVLIDKLAGKVQIMGVDYAAPVNALL